MARISKSRKRRLAIIGTASIIAFAFFCLTTINYTYKIIKLTNKQNELVETLNNLKTEKEQLDIEIEKLQNEEYIARYARENYLYTKNNEYVIKMQENSNEIDATEKEINKLNNARTYIVYASLAGLVILVIIARTKKS
nr:septum formation initiator family protein [Bacilli bacterium]